MHMQIMITNSSCLGLEFFHKKELVTHIARNGEVEEIFDDDALR